MPSFMQNLTASTRQYAASDVRALHSHASAKEPLLELKKGAVN